MDGAKGNGLILKFTEKKYLDEVLHGHFFMKNIKYFWKLEKNEKLGIKDPSEGSLVRNLDPDTTTWHVKVEGTASPFIKLPKTNRAKLEIKYKVTEDISICSFVFLDFGLDFLEVEKDIFEIKEEVVDSLIKEFGSRPAVIISPGVFQDALESINPDDYEGALKLKTDFVRYRHGYQKMSKEDFDLAPEQAIDLAFEKADTFKNQKEFRIAFQMNSSQDFDVQTIDFLMK